MKKFILLFVFAGILPSTSHAFKWSKCKKVYKAWEMTQSKSKSFTRMLTDQLAQLTSQATFQSSTSTTSYVSSTGDCAAFAKAEEERIEYVAQTMTELKMEAADGQGEHVTALAKLYGCSPSAQSEFSNSLKNNYSKIFYDKNNSNPLAITESITDQVVTNKNLNRSCNLEQI